MHLQALTSGALLQTLLLLLSLDNEDIEEQEVEAHVRHSAPVRPLHPLTPRPECQFMVMCVHAAPGRPHVAFTPWVGGIDRGVQPTGSIEETLSII